MVAFTTDVSALAAVDTAISTTTSARSPTLAQLFASSERALIDQSFALTQACAT